MADPVADPAPSPSTPAVDPAAPAPAVADPNPADPASAAPKPADPAPSVAPDKYDFAAVKLPDGVTLDAELLSELEPAFKAEGLSQEAASKLVEAHANAVGKLEAKREADFKQWMATTVKGYQDTLRKEWGSEHDANVTVAQRGIARFCAPELKKLLDDTGLGSHPEFVRAFHQIGKMVLEDKPPITGLPNGRKANEAVFYGAN
jgi:hypothetical protein